MTTRYEPMELPFRIVDEEDLTLRVQKNFEEIARLLGVLQIYENNTGMPLNEIVNSNHGSWSSAVTNFDSRNDRIDTVPADPVIETDGSALGHTIRTDGSASISFEWGFTGTGNAYDIDGFVVYYYATTASGAYTFGTDPANEQVHYVTKDKRAFILQGTPADIYYTFGVQAYRAVDQDINTDGILKSNIVKPSVAGENPYQPSSNVAFSGEVIGTVNAEAGIATKTAGGITDAIDGFGDGSDGVFDSEGNVTFNLADDDLYSIVKQYTSFTLNEGHTLTVDKRCRGLFILVRGDVTISSTIDLSGKAAKVSQDSSAMRLIQIPVGTVVLEIPPGGAGGRGSDGEGGVRGGTGANGSDGTYFGGGIGGAGGGGAGGTYVEPNSGGDGGDGGSSDLDTIFGLGGAGGAGGYGTGAPSHPTGFDGTVGGNFAGGGGAGGGMGEYVNGVGGAGGKGGDAPGSGAGGGSSGGLGNGNVGVNGSPGSTDGGFGGGLVCIIAKGDITINASGVVNANGIDGADGGAGGTKATCGSGGSGGGQGGGGGGAIAFAHKGSYTNSGSVTVDAGSVGSGGSSGTSGTVGSILTLQL